VVAALRAAGCVFAEEEAAILVAAASGPADLLDRVRRRAEGLPLEQVVGWAAFCGLRIEVDPGVFVPRRRSELLAAEAVARARAVTGRVPVVVDLCCGAGALGAVVAAACPVELYAADVDAAAVACARRNLGEGVQVLRGDLVDPLPTELRGRVDVLVANVPYVPTEEISLLPVEARVHEPRVALDGGADGLRVLARVARAAPAWLAPGGSLLAETSDRQSAAALEVLRGSGLAASLSEDEDLGATVVVGVRSA
jgi:release factor glutamine methyltransferase